MINANLPKTSDLISELTEAQPRKEVTQQVIASGVLSERELGTRKQGHRDIWLSDRGEPTRERIGEVRRH